MASKQIMFDDAALIEMKKGVDRLAEAVKCTMGPAGRHVVIEKSYGGPSITKDGVSVAKEVSLSDFKGKKNVVVAFFLSRKAGWSVGFTLVALAAGLIPLLIFWVEHRVMQKLKEENPDLAGVADSRA